MPPTQSSFPNADELERWTNSVARMMRETANILGFEHCEIVPATTEVPADLPCTRIALTNERSSVQLDLHSRPDARQNVARTMLEIDPEEDDISTDDVNDAMGEIVNIVFGGVKGELDPTMQLGFPEHNVVADDLRSSTSTLRVRVDEDELVLVLRFS